MYEIGDRVKWQRATLKGDKLKYRIYEGEVSWIDGEYLGCKPNGLKRYHKVHVTHIVSEKDIRLADAAPKLLAGLVEAVEWLERAPIEYRNGVEYMGMDEGDVIGTSEHIKLVAKLRGIIAEIDGEKS